MENEIDNTKEIAEQIFKKSPGKKNSIQLQLDDNSDFSENSEKYITDVLSMITLHGINILFGHSNLLELNETQINLIKQYTYSFGYNFKYEIDEEKGNLYIYFEKIY